MATEYISREAMHKANQDEWQGVYGFVDCDIFEDNENMIDRVPAADVRPVVRGRWEPNVRHDDCLVCTKCGCGYPAVGFAWIDCNRRSDERESAVFITNIMNFCPNCGADMREERTE